MGVDNVPDQGSVIGLKVGLESATGVKSAALATQCSQSLGTRGRANIAHAAQRHILVVEDAPNNRRLLEILLGKKGHRVSAVANGQQAVEWVMYYAIPDLILMDYRMPVMDGIEATRQIRTWENETARPLALPIIALTASAFDHDRMACLTGGMNEVLSKPFHSCELYAVIDKWLPVVETVVRPRVMEPGNSAMAGVAPNAMLLCGKAAPPINFSAALDRLGGDLPTFLHFAAAVPAQIEQDRAVILRYARMASDATGANSVQFMVADNVDGLRKASHRLNGTLATLGAERAQAACLALEIAAKLHAFSTYGKLFEELDAALQVLTPALADILKHALVPEEVSKGAELSPRAFSNNVEENNEP